MEAALPMASERMRAAPFVRVLALAAIAGGLLLAALLAFVRREQHVTLGGEIVHDEYGFRVRELDIAPRSPSSGAPNASRAVTVRFDVSNRSRRVPFDLATWTPVLVDARGTRIEPDGAAEAELAHSLGRARLREGHVAAGGSETCTAVFAVPAEARELHFSISWGGGALDLFDSLIFGAKDIALGELDAASAR